MSTEKQLESWLRRSEKSFCENLQFAIRIMLSAEFTLSKKYEIILIWIVEEGGKQKDLPCNKIKEVLEIRLQSTNVTLEVKEKFINMLLQQDRDETCTSELPGLLCKLLATEWMQDLLRSNHNVKARVYALLLKCYERCLNSNDATRGAKLTAQQTDLITQVLNLLKDHTQSAENKQDLAHQYDKHIHQPLTQVLLVLRSKYNIDFFDELRQIEQLLRVCTIDVVRALIKRLPMHSVLVMLECVIVNQRLEQSFQIEVIKCIFRKIKKHETDGSILLTRAAYVLNILQKHNMLLNYEIEGESVLKFLGDHIYQYASAFKENNINDVLLLLCAALRLNPLILEQHIFELTTWMIVTPKYTENAAKTNMLFEEFLILLLEMFRRLSRAEKFVVNLLKALNKWLSEHELQPLSKKVTKRKLEALSTSPSKREKLENCSFASDVSIHNENSDFYMEMLFGIFNSQNQALKHAAAPKTLRSSFTYLHAAWPSDTIGFAFSRLITGLVTKASMTIWKTLLFALKDQLAALAQENVDLTSENALFGLDMHAALLCQFFAGAKLMEQYERYAEDIKKQRLLTNELLASFGKFVLNHEYHKRTISAFLECCYNAANFELLLAYYKPDGFVDNSLTAEKLVPHLHSYLAAKEWSVIQQRIRNYGKQHERELYERLLLQRAEAQKLLQTATAPSQTSVTTVLGCDTDPSSMAQFLASSPHPYWLIEQFDRNEKIALISFKCENLTTLASHNFLMHIRGNSEALELLAYGIFERLFVEFKSHNKSSLIAALNCNFNLIRQCSPQDHMGFDKIIKSLVVNINENFGNNKVKTLPTETIATVIELLHQLPLAHLRRQIKTLLFIFYLTFYEDLKIAQAEEETKQVFDCLSDFLHFGPQVPIFRYFDMKIILELLPIADCWEFYEFLFSTIKNEEKGTDEFLKSLEEMLRDALETSATLKSEQRRLLLIAIESFASFNGIIGRRIYKHFQVLLDIYGNYIYAYFKTEMNAQKTKKFVEKTLAGFAPFANSILLTAATENKNNISKETTDVRANEAHEQQTLLKPLDEDFRRICKIYIGHSMDYRNTHALKLMQVALNHRVLLHLDQDEIEFVLTGYWRQLNADMQQKPINALSETTTNELVASKNLNEKNLEILMRMIIENKTNEDFLLTLKDISSSAKCNQNYAITLEMLTLIGKTKFSTIKGAIFNEQIKQISSNTIHRLTKNPQQQFVDQEIVLKMLNLQKICVDNKSIPVTPDTLDSVLAFLIEINIKKFTLTDINNIGFFTLHAAMTSLCTTLVKQRHILLMDRVPEFMQIFKDLLQAVIQYKSERQKETLLDSKELEQLAELALKLEVLMHNIAAHSTDVKRVAPFVLIFAINLMVTCKRPTTLYSKIKTHIEAICYSLIGICDHRIGRFILRCSNEAARQTYELLVKEHKKYHKFKGKV